MGPLLKSFVGIHPIKDNQTGNNSFKMKHSYAVKPNCLPIMQLKYAKPRFTS